MVFGRVAMIAALLVPAAALADPFAEFRIPEHRAFRWSADLSTSASRNEPIRIRP